jgi:hypothetical protein
MQKGDGDMIKISKIKVRPAPGTKRAAIIIRPDTSLGTFAGNRIVNSVGLFVDEPDRPSDHHAEFRAVGAHGRDEP